jgi:hypothetical protein
MAMGLDVIGFIVSPSITQKKSRGLLSAHGFKIVKNAINPRAQPKPKIKKGPQT